MSKKKRILMIVFLLLVVAIAGVLFWQWDNVDAIIQSVRYDEGTIEEMMSENESQIQETLDLYPELQVRPLDEETKEKFNSGELTEEEVIEILTRPSMDKTPIDSENQSAEKNTSDSLSSEPSKDEPSKSEASKTEPTKSVSEANEEIAKLVARVYVIQMDFVGRLSGIEAKARAEIAKLPEKQQTYDRKIAIGKSYVGEMSALEAQCDGEISAIVSKVRKLLTESGQSTVLADTIKNSYEREKSLKKAYYMNRYL